MPGLTAAIASIVHVGGFALAAAFGALRLVALRRQDVAATRFADNGNGIAALLLFGGGLWRLFGQLEKPLAFYSANPVFWVKLGAIAAMVGLEVYPQYVVLPWHFRHARKQPIEPRPGQFARMSRCAVLQLPCLVIAVACAALMARGVGLPTTAAPASDLPGRAIYATHCQACHQADGRGLDGKLAADFVGDARILARPDDALLRSIADGTVGRIGAMPAWRAILSAEQQRHVLAYIRAAFAPTPRR